MKRSAPKIVDLGRELNGVSFMDGATLIGKTPEGEFSLGSGGDANEVKGRCSSRICGS